MDESWRPQLPSPLNESSMDSIGQSSWADDRVICNERTVGNGQRAIILCPFDFLFPTTSVLLGPEVACMHLD
jgi:hypothetical protein